MVRDEARVVWELGGVEPARVGGFDHGAVVVVWDV